MGDGSLANGLGLKREILFNINFLLEIVVTVRQNNGCQMSITGLTTL
jgi:hypothetical protein